MSASRKRDHPRVVERVQREMLSRGLRQLDGRSRLSLTLKQLRAELIEEVGGDNAAPSLIAAVDIAVRTRLLLDSIDGYILKLGDRIVNKKRKTLYPLVEQRQKIADSLTNQLMKITELRQAGEVERRVEALEDNRNA